MFLKKVTCLILACTLVLGQVGVNLGGQWLSFAEDSQTENSYQEFVSLEENYSGIQEVEVGQSLEFSAKVIDSKGNEITYYDELDDQQVPLYTQFSWALSQEEIGEIKYNVSGETQAVTFTAQKSGLVHVDIKSIECKTAAPMRVTIQVKGSGEAPPVDPPKPPVEDAFEDRFSAQYAAEIDTAIADLSIRYRNPIFYGSDGLSNKYTDFLALGLRQSGFEAEEIFNKKNIFPTAGQPYYRKNISRNILTLIASNENPELEVQKLLDPSYIFYENIEPDQMDQLVYAIIALDLAKANYKQMEAVNALISGLKKDADGKIYVETMECIDPEMTAKAIIALSKHRSEIGVEETLLGLKKTLKTLQAPSGLVKSVNSWSENESALVTSYLIQALMALGENPLSAYWQIKDGNGGVNDLVKGLLACKKDQRFSESPIGSGTDLQTNAALGALADLRLNLSMFDKISYVKPGLPFVVKLNVPNVENLVEGDQIALSAYVLDENNQPVRNALLKWESSDLAVATVSNGLVQTLKEGVVTLKVSVLDQANIFAEVSLTIKSGVSEEVLRAKLLEEIAFLKKHYEAYNQYEFLAAPAANAAGLPKEGIQNKLYKVSRYTTATQYARLIISALGAELNPRAIVIEKTQKNAVDLLKASQVLSGDYKGQFHVNLFSDKDNIEALAYAMIALDQAKAQYDVASASEALLKLLNKEDFRMQYGEDEVRLKAIAMTALAKHKNFVGVSAYIEQTLALFKVKQNEEGGFASKMSPNCALTTSRVVQALMAEGINPLFSKEWMKNKHTMLDSLLKNKYVHPKDIKLSGYSEFQGGSSGYQVTYSVFGAFMEMYLGESLFTKYELESVQPIVKGLPKRLTIQGPANNRLTQGQSFTPTVFTWDEHYNLLENESLKWRSSDSSIVSVDKGVIRAIKSGKVDIYAYLEDPKIESKVAIEVVESGVKSIDLKFQKDKVRVGDEWPISANGMDLSGNEVKGLKYLWHVDGDQSVELIEKNGQMFLRGLKKGPFTVRVQLEGQTGIEKTFSGTCIDRTMTRVKVRIESSRETLIPETEMQVDNFDMAQYSSEACLINESPTAMNALIEALQENGLDVKDPKNFDAGKDLKMLNAIKGVKTFDKGPNSGWMYYLNDQYVPDFLRNTPLKEGDQLTLFYVEDYLTTTYSYFEQQEVFAKPGEAIQMVLKGNSYALGDHKIKGATLEVRSHDGKMVHAGASAITDARGIATLQFEKEGTYFITASKITDKGAEITRPFAKIKVDSKALEEKIKLEVLQFERNTDDLEGVSPYGTLKIAIENKTTKAYTLYGKVDVYNEQNELISSFDFSKILKGQERDTFISTFALIEKEKYTIKVFLSEDLSDLDKKIFMSTQL